MEICTGTGTVPLLSRVCLVGGIVPNATNYISSADSKLSFVGLKKKVWQCPQAPQGDAQVMIMCVSNLGYTEALSPSSYALPHNERND